MDEDTSSFWAGRLDDVFGEHQSETGDLDSPEALNSRGEGNNLISLDGEKLNNARGEEKADSRCGDGLGTDKIFAGKRRNIDDSGLIKSGTSGDISWSCNNNRAPHAELPGEGDKGSALGVAGEHIGVRVEEGLGSTSGCSSSSSSDKENTNSRAITSQESETAALEDESERLPDHLLIELLVRVPSGDWPAAACVKKRWAQLFKGDGLWQSALTMKWPTATSTKRWPGPIARGSNKRRYTALHVSDCLFVKEKVEGVNEVAGHVYLFLKEQLESTTPPVSYGLLHGTIIDQFLACCKTGDEAHELASHIWIAVLDNLDESENTFHLLMRIAEEWEIFLPYPYSKSRAVQWRLFERLFTDFRDCLSRYNYFDILTRARNKFELIPQTWLGY